MKVDTEKFREVTEPVIKWMNDSCHPHCAIMIDQTRAELTEGVCAFTTEEFIKD